MRGCPQIWFWTGPAPYLTRLRSYASSINPVSNRWGRSLQYGSRKWAEAPSPQINRNVSHVIQSTRVVQLCKTTTKCLSLKHFYYFSHEYMQDMSVIHSTSCLVSEQNVVFIQRNARNRVRNERKKSMQHTQMTQGQNARSYTWPLRTLRWI